MNKSYYNPKGQEVGYLKDGIFYKNTRQFMVMFQGYGISDSIIEELVVDECKTVQITYKSKKILHSFLSQWVNSKNKFVDSSMGFVDPQTFVPEKEMEVLE